MSTAPRPRPSIDALRAKGQPANLLDRRSGEHWMGRLYLRRVSPYGTRVFVAWGTAPNTLTFAMIGTGLLAAAVAALVPGVLGAVLAVLLVQLYMLLDCIDGEVARFTGRTSMVGVYLDRVGHYSCEAALLVGLGFRAAGGLDGGWVGGYQMLGLAAALGAVLIKAETDLVHVARAHDGAPPATDAAATPRAGGMAALRRLAQSTGFHRLILAAELSLVMLVCAIVDAFTGSGASPNPATRVLIVACAIVAGVQAVLHLVAILASRRLR